MRSNLASPSAARRTAAQVELRQQQRDNDLRAVLSTAEGRRMLWWLLDDLCGLHSSAFGGNTADLTFREGRRDVGVKLMQHAQAVAPDSYVASLLEHVAAAKEEALHRDDAQTTATAEEAEHG